MKRVVMVFVILQVVKCKESVYMKHSEVEDQATSASGYAYQVHSGGPLNYPSNVVPLNHFGYPPITVGRYTQEIPLQLPLAEEYKPQPSPKFYPVNSYGVPVQPYALGYQHLLQPAKISSDEGQKFVKGGGSNYGTENQSSQGEQGAAGYKKLEEYDKGSQGKHENEAHKGYYSKEGGNKAGHHEVGAHYNKKEEAAKGSEGASFKQSSGHKKGSKTTGYHRVHHKDEYKKDHTFYDESDASGHFHKYGDFDSQHNAARGGFQKGGQEDGAYQSSQQGAKGFQDKGKHIDQDSAYKGEHGNEAHYKDFQQYGKEGGQEAGKEEGYSEKGAKNLVV